MRLEVGEVSGSSAMGCGPSRPALDRVKLETGTEAMSVSALLRDLEEALALESKYQPHLQLSPGSSNTSDSGEISTSMRDGAAHVLRCLKVWYDLPSSVFLAAINIMDRFLTRMKARPKHLSCIAISAFHLAAVRWAEQLGGGAQARGGELLVGVPEPQDLVTISQCKCTAGDVTRMEAIVEAKLGTLPQTTPTTSFTFLRLFHALWVNTTVTSPSASSSTAPASQPRAEDEGDAMEVDNFGPASLQSSDLSLLTMSYKMETLACDASYSNFRPAELALALMWSELRSLSPGADDVQASWASFMAQLQSVCKIEQGRLYSCLEWVVSLLSHYERYGQAAPAQRQRLTWRLSRRTLKQLRPTDRLVCVLPTIQEHRKHPATRARRQRLQQDKGMGNGWRRLGAPKRDICPLAPEDVCLDSTGTFRCLFGADEEPRPM